MKLSRRNRRRIFTAAIVTAFVSALWWAWPSGPAKSPTADSGSGSTPATAAPLPGSGQKSASLTGAAAAENKGPAPAAKTGAAPKTAESVAPKQKVQLYKVASGDTAGSIAERFGLKSSTILWSNGLTEDSVLQIGQELSIPATDGLIHSVGEGDTFWDIATTYGVDLDALVIANPDISPDSLQPGQKLLVPNGAPPRRSNQIASRSSSGARPEPAAAAGSVGLRWPLQGTITEWFGWRTHPVYGTRNYHEGIDIGVDPGTPVRAIAAGRVTLAEWYGGYGLTVRIDHGNGLVSRYSHNSKNQVAAGQWVEAGEVIALSGNTGVSTGPHLDFGIYRNGEPVDPLSMLP